LDIIGKETAEGLDEPDSMQALEQMVEDEIIDVVNITPEAPKIPLVKKRKTVSCLLIFEFTNFNLGSSFAVG
jgi:hypothetical protein